MEFAQKLIWLRKKKGLSRMDVSKVSGISYLQLTKYEKGDSYPSLIMINKLVEALDVSPLEFFNYQRRDEKLMKIKDIITQEGAKFSDVQIDGFLSILESMSSK